MRNFAVVNNPQGEKILKEWIVDREGIKDSVSWARKNRGGKKLLEDEIRNMSERFPFFIATVASDNKIIKCKRPGCGGMIAWVDGLKCLSCDQLYNPPKKAQLAFVGTVRSIVGKVDPNGRFVNEYCRPVFKDVFPKISLREDLYLRYFVRDENKDYFFQPLIKIILPTNWSRQEPLVMFHTDYFKALNIPREHVYFERYNGWHKLCLFSNWRRYMLFDVLEQRVVPRIISDLMFADLVSLGKLREVLDNLGASLSSVYNWVGKVRSGRSERFWQEYSKYVKF